MNRQNYLKQVLVLDEHSHREYLDDFEEEPLSFGEFVNVMLGVLFDDGHNIDQIIPLNNGSIVFVIYLMQMNNPPKK